MEALPQINAELTDTTSQIIKDCLGTSVILRQVLEHFSNGELLQLSLVNKQWSFQARSVLKIRGNVVARVRSDDVPSCQDLEAFMSDLRKMRVVPFSGVHVKLSHRGDVACKSTPNGPLGFRYQEILELLPWKILSVDFHDDWSICKECPALVLVTKVLDNFCGVLEQVSLTLRGHDAEPLEHVNAVVHWSTFPILKTLKLDMDTTDGRLPFCEFAKALATRAPKLQELHLMRNVDVNKDILEGSLAVLVPCCRFNPLYDRVCPSLTGKLRATKMEICRRTSIDESSVDFNVELLKRHVPAVLQASQTTLKTLQMDLLFAIPLMTYGIVLKNLTLLEIRLDGRLGIYIDARPQPWVPRLLMGFNFSNVFPILDHVWIMNDITEAISPMDVVGFGRQGIKVLERTLPDRAVRIKHLTLIRRFMDYTPPQWAEIFPHVETISVFERHFTRGIPFRIMWEHFMHLRELRIIITASPTAVDNMDCALCGIFQEEVAEMREKDDEYLRAVNIVPVMPSITCMKDLKALMIQYAPEPNLVTETGPTFMFSKVTGLIGFARCPNLAVIIHTRSQEHMEALGHMKPYVSFVTGD